MSRGRIFLLSQDVGTLLPMDETPFAKEDVLQELLANYPDLLPGDQMTPDAPRRWLLVARELGVPGNFFEGDRWSLDHLFLDQDGCPTFVECKRVSDTRARREVVAQMLDYAANGSLYWGMDRLRQAATETAQRRGVVIDDAVRALINAPDDEAIEAFWRTVEANLRAGRIRLIFVADSIPKELRRMVEFLNAKMTDVEIIAVEVKQFLGGQQRAVVSHVIGLTEAARERKLSATPRGVINRETLLANCTAATCAFYTHLLDQAEARGLTVGWASTSASIQLLAGGQRKSVIYCFVPDKLEVYLGYLQLPEATLEVVRARLRQLNVFQERGKHTVRLLVTEATVPQIEPICEALFGVLEEVAGV